MVKDKKQTARAIVTDEDFLRIRAACPVGDWQGAVEVAYFAGLRMSELRALKVEEVDLIGGQLLVNSGHVRRVPLDPVLRVMLDRKLATDHRDPGEPLWDLATLKASAFADVVVKAGLVDEDGKARFTFEDLRRAALIRWSRSMTCLPTLLEIGGLSARALNGVMADVPEIDCLYISAIAEHQRETIPA